MRRWALLLFVCATAFAKDTSAERTVVDYQYFRALSIDLAGRPPTPQELAEFEQPQFDLDKWIDAHLHGSSYAERIRRIYMDLMRLELPPTFRYEPAPLALYRAVIQGPHGESIAVYHRLNQRRQKLETDGAFCFTSLEAGVSVNPDASVTGTAAPVSQQLLDERTVLVKPWWLYADYRSHDPRDRIGPDWDRRYPGYQLEDKVFVDPDGKPTTAVRVCREEAQTAESGRVLVTGRAGGKGAPIPPGRTRRAPGDTPFAKANPNRVVSCLTHNGFENSADCGCGVGLERCMPTNPGGFVVPVQAPLGIDEPFVAGPQPASLWSQRWWAEEAAEFIGAIVSEDRDVRELLTSRSTIINGPLAQFYRFFVDARCCGSGLDLGYVDPKPLFDPHSIPTSLIPEDTDRWVWVDDRGPEAAGLMTMPVFLIKYGSRRARAHVLYNTFLCRDFVAESAKLTPSTEPDLTKRPGCATCHQTLEPLAAYFSRISETDWMYLPASTFPLSLDRCRASDPKQMPGVCKPFYDPDFSDAKHVTLRGAYAAPDHAEQGPPGLARAITSSPDFAPCVVKNVAQSLLGRPLTPEEDSWKAQLAKDFAAHGYKMRSLVRAIVTSAAYKSANDRLEPKP